jgi:hypothetical protein
MVKLYEAGNDRKGVFRVETPGTNQKSETSPRRNLQFAIRQIRSDLRIRSKCFNLEK